MGTASDLPICYTGNYNAVLSLGDLHNAGQNDYIFNKYANLVFAQNIDDLFRFMPFLNTTTQKKIPHPNDIRADSHIT